MVFTLTRAAGAYLRPGPIYPHQIVPGQNVPYIPQCGRTRKPEASRRFAVHANRGVEIACDFVCRENTSGKSNFCVLLFADKRTWLPGIGQRGAAGYRQTYLCASMRRKNFPRDNTPVPCRTPFWSKPEKIRGALLREGTFRVMRETPTGTASRRFLLRFGSPAPDWLGGNLFLLMRLRARDTFFR